VKECTTQPGSDGVEYRLSLDPEMLEFRVALLNSSDGRSTMIPGQSQTDDNPSPSTESPGPGSHHSPGAAVPSGTGPGH
jgi:hypothetical protein